MCRKYQKVGQMEFGNKVDISDPCYERDGESNVIDYGIESGTYGCYIKFGKEEYGEECILDINDDQKQVANNSLVGTPKNELIFE